MILEISKTQFHLSFSFVALITLMLLLCREDIVMASLLCSFFHEGGHLIMMYLSDSQPQRVEISLFGMRIERRAATFLSYNREIIIALGGIIFNLILSAAAFILNKIFYCEFLRLISLVSLIVALINSFPVSVLDGAGALRYMLHKSFSQEKAEAILSALSDIFFAVFLLVSLIYTLFFGVNLSLTAVNIYLFFVTVLKKWS